MHLTRPDTSRATLIFDRLNVIDAWETITIYRRDLIYNAEYATVPQLPAHEVTSVDVPISDGDATTTQTFVY
jgi:hypothetical protein